MKYLALIILIVSGCTGLEYDGEDRNPPIVTIVEPFDGATVSNDVEFTGSATDPEDGNISSQLAWTSDIDGNLGFEPTVTATLSSGTHVITAQATDAAGNTGTATVTVTVND